MHEMLNMVFNGLDVACFLFCQKKCEKIFEMSLYNDVDALRG